MSYYRVKVQEIQVLGEMWMPPCLAAHTYKVRDYDLENMLGEDSKPTRESVQRWLDCNAGDFSQIIDFRADLGDWPEIDWADEQNKCAWMDIMFNEGA